MSFRRVKAGEPVRIPAPAYNAWCEAAEAHRAGNASFASSTSGDRPDYTRVKVRNDSGADQSRFAVLGISGPLFTPTDNLAEFLRAPKMVGAMPATAQECLHDAHRPRSGSETGEQYADLVSQPIEFPGQELGQSHRV